MKFISVVGARPQFIKAALMSRALRQRHHEILVHTGQHYDDNMSQIFFTQLGLPEPDINLAVGSGSHGRQTGQMLIRIEDVLISETPNWVLVYGDTNSTLAAALAAAKLNVRVAHVEAGLRSFNRSMPEEINRVATDHLSSLLFCPSQTAVNNLASEGIRQGVHLVGDVMADILNFAQENISQSNILTDLGLVENEFLLATIHRAENTDDVVRLNNILTALEAVDETIIFPVHPRTRGVIDKIGYTGSEKVKLIEPVGYLDMIKLSQAARLILTDSGGLQKEAYWLGVPCITLRDETEWVETAQTGWNVVVGADVDRIVQAVQTLARPNDHPPLYGDGQAVSRCINHLEEA